MKLFLVALLSLTVVRCASLGLGSHYHIRKHSEVTLKDGLPVLFIEDHSLPYFSVIMMVKSGSSADPKGQYGVANLVAQLLDKGTAKQNAIQIADGLEQYGGSFAASVGHDYTMLTGESLSIHKDELLKDFLAIVTQPSFPTAEIRREKRRILAMLAKRVDHPSDFASQSFSSFLFGDHPYGRNPAGDKLHVQKLSKLNVIRFYLSHYRPNNSYLAVVGDFNTSDIRKKLEAGLADWKARPVDKVVYPNLADLHGLHIELVNKNDLKQAQIRFGHFGIQRTNPDFLPLRVANTILGGAFASRLMKEIRIKRGLTYGAYSSFSSGKTTGSFEISTFTRNAKVGETVSETLKVLKEFVKDGVSAEEVKSAKALLKGIFPRVLETPESLAQNMLILRYYGISDSYITDYLRNIDRISVSDVNRVIKKYIHPDDMKVLVYAKGSATLHQLKPIAPVEVKNYKSFL